MKTVIIEKAKKLAATLPTESLKGFALTCPDEVLNVVLDELESRMSESEFLSLCKTL